jgi:hypothetical protein
MRYVFLSLAAIATIALLSASLVVRADDAKEKIDSAGITGILIDQHCGEKMMAKDKPEEAAADHPRDCAMKEACAKSGYAVISGSKMYKFDEHGDALAKEFLEKSKLDKDLRVRVSGFIKDDTIKVSAIVAAPK